MDSSLRELLGRLDHLSAQFQELRQGVRQAITIAEQDPEMSLTRARKVLEFVIRAVYERRVGEPAGTRPLENLLQRLAKDGHLPRRIAAYANAVRELGNLGTHAFGEAVTQADVVQSLTQLMFILEWYFEQEGQQPPVTAGNVDATTATPSAGPSPKEEEPTGSPDPHPTVGPVAPPAPELEPRAPRPDASTAARPTSTRSATSDPARSTRRRIWPKVVGIGLGSLIAFGLLISVVARLGIIPDGRSAGPAPPVGRGTGLENDLGFWTDWLTIPSSGEILVRPGEPTPKEEKAMRQYKNGENLINE